MESIGPVILIWLVGFITGLACARIISRSHLKQCYNLLDRASKTREETDKTLERISTLGEMITIKHENMKKMWESIQKFNQEVGRTKPPDWDQEKKKLPDQL